MTTVYSDEDILSHLESLYKIHGEINTTIVRKESGPTNKTISRRFGSLGRAVSLSDIQHKNLSECRYCGGAFQHLGKHVSQSNCKLPELTETQEEIVIGILMGDGTITEGVSNCKFALSMINEEFVNWIKSELEPFSSTVTVQKTENKDLYRLTTTPHSYFTELRSWYSSGSKRFPNDLELTPLILKMWYVTDGGRSNGYPRITAANEDNREKYLCSLFNPLPFRVKWDGEKDIQINSNDVDGFYQYIGSPPPGFDYKWP